MEIEIKKPSIGKVNETQEETYARGGREYLESFRQFMLEKYNTGLRVFINEFLEELTKNEDN